jgi:hypothetical protein
MNGIKPMKINDLMNGRKAAGRLSEKKKASRSLRAAGLSLLLVSTECLFILKEAGWAALCVCLLWQKTANLLAA